MSTIRANQWLNQDGTENYKCRAWVNFNGIGVVAIRGAGNVASILDINVGDYGVNFITPLEDLNYCMVGTASTEQTGNLGRTVNLITRSTTQPRIQSGYVTTVAVPEDEANVCVAFFR